MKGSSFFAKRFEEVVDHIRIYEDGEIEFDAPYFARLFGDFITSERRTLMELGFWWSLVPDGSRKRSTFSSPAHFSSLWEGFGFSGALHALTDADLLSLIGQSRFVEEPHRRARFLWRKISKPPYISTPGMKAVSLHLKRRVRGLQAREAFDKGDYVALVASGLRGLGEALQHPQVELIFPEHGKALNRIRFQGRYVGDLFHREAWKRAIEFDAYAELLKDIARGDAYWGSAARGHAARADWLAAIAAVRREIEFNPTDAGAWQLLSFLQREQGALPAAVASAERAAQLEPSRFNSWYQKLLKENQRWEQSEGSAAGLEEKGALEAGRAALVEEVSIVDFVGSGKYAAGVPEGQRVLAKTLLDNGAVTIAAGVVGDVFQLITDSDLTAAANMNLNRSPIEGVRFIVSGELRTEQNFQGQGLIVPSNTQGSFNRPGISLRILDPVSEQQMLALTPLAWIALNLDRNLTVNQVLSLRLSFLTSRDERGRTIYAVFA